MKVYVRGTLVHATDTPYGSMKAVIVSENGDIFNIVTKRNVVKEKITSNLGLTSLFGINVNVEGIPTAFDFDIEQT